MFVAGVDPRFNPCFIFDKKWGEIYYFGEIEFRRNKMSVFSLFKPKSKVCSVCGLSFPKCHNIYSDLKHGKKVAELCSNCLVSELNNKIKGKSIVFFEPLSEDSYCYSKMDEINNKAVYNRILETIENIREKCDICSNAASHLWIPTEDLDEEEMENQKNDEYFNIPLPKNVRKHSKYYCDEHIKDHLFNYFDKKRVFFLTFRFPDSSKNGFYW